jgi:hypothetical protein
MNKHLVTLVALAFTATAALAGIPAHRTNDERNPEPVEPSERLEVGTSGPLYNAPNPKCPPTPTPAPTPRETPRPFPGFHRGNFNVQ